VTLLVDSDVLIEVLRSRDDSILAEWQELSESDANILYSPISEAELWAGVRPKEERALAALFHALQCVWVDSEIGRRAGEYLLQYRKSHSLEIAGAIIAASASTRRAFFWTRNKKHYPMKDLKFWDHVPVD
jgi:predicted nucleic acid-binding protein